MSTRRQWLLTAASLLAVAGVGAWWWAEHPPPRYLSEDPSAFVAQFAAPPGADSEQTRRELDELLDLQRTRTAAQARAAQADKKKDVSRFYAALGLDVAHTPPLPALQAFTDRAEAEIGPYVRAAKDRFRRLRPYEIEPKLEPCIDDVKGDQSYPSGHAAYGYLMGLLLSELVPERRPVLMARAEEFARQRMMCGVHFRGDIEAGARGAEILFARMRESAEFRRDLAAAREEVRAALGLPPLSGPG